MLLFEPLRFTEGGFERKNICVGCGEKDHYLRHRVVPTCYSTQFPAHLKSHRYHIVLLCVNCHEVAHSAAEKFKRHIADEFNIPLCVQKSLKDRGRSEASFTRTNSVCEGASPLNLRAAAVALLRHGSRMPLERRDELVQIVREYFGGKEISTRDLEMASLVGMSSHHKSRLQNKKRLRNRSSEGKKYISTCPGATDNGSTGSANSHESSKSRDVTDDDAVINASIHDVDVTNDIDSFPSDSHEWRDHKSVGHNIGDASSFPSNSGNIDLSEDLVGRGPSPLLLPNTESSKLLVGHALHGKQVVEHLLRTDGEDGINSFCQRWRQVFIEAVRPRFLPSDWAAQSPPTEFGEYSVFHPANRNVR